MTNNTESREIRAVIDRAKDGDVTALSVFEKSHDGKINVSHIFEGADAHFVAGLTSQIQDLKDEIERLKRWRLSEPDEDLAETMEESGFWQSCSGCHETNEGASTGWYPVHPFFKCEQGSGCGECGGIGVIWDDTDYEDMVNWMREEESRKALSNKEG